MPSFKVRDFRNKKFFMMDDTYLNGYAKLVTPSVTVVYMSLCRHADQNQKSFPSLELIADQHSLSISTIQRAIRKLLSLNIIKVERTRSKNGKWLRNTYYLLDKTEWKKPQVMDDRRSKTSKPQVMDDRIRKHIKKDTHTLSISKRTSLKGITENDMKYIANFYNVPIPFVRSKYDDLINYCESRGRRYKNYVSALRKFVKDDAIKIRQNNQNDRHKAVDARNI